MNFLKKTEIVEVYIETSFKECVMHCTDKGIISKVQEKRVFEQYNSNKDLESEVICNFFDEIGIDEEEFLTISNKLD
ncbi:MAG: hypothetical protein ACJAVA_000272 [Flavobacteriaceae bacterium]|jgi:hypothetical protein